MITTKNAVYSMTEIKSVHLSFRVGQVVSFNNLKTSLKNFTTISYLVAPKQPEQSVSDDPPPNRNIEGRLKK